MHDTAIVASKFGVVRGALPAKLNWEFVNSPEPCCLWVPALLRWWSRPNRDPVLVQEERLAHMPANADFASARRRTGLPGGK